MNATRARILRGVDASGHGAGQAELVMRTRHRHLRLMMDRHLALAGPAPSPSSRPPGTVDALAEDERDFVRQVVQVLETHRLAGDFEHLAVFATPPLLGRLHTEMPARLAAILIAERPRCLVHLPEAELLQAVCHDLGASEP
ncbi:protein required for attachment to host cells [Rhodovulum euryhalinum]|uniref:Protein required for attachment to host cells n=2 Tax=Rhodovulum euryhalinum TaxID=35805 RepID=A0A4R2KNK7_9RHOB|nr:protein required for attachment to host cells [Rhodovulum euryhalinum]